jgi:hypothetical protein
MKTLASFLWIILALGALVYWSNTSANRSRPSTAADDYSDDTSAHDPDTFRGDTCTVDCSGHQAGYDWAERRNIDDEDNCGGNSESFIEGCKAYVLEQQGASADEDSDHDDAEPEDNE